MSKSATRWILALSCVLVVAGFLIPLWPLSILGIAIAALSGRWIVAISIGFLLDIAYGAPVGQWHFLYVPFTFFALAVAGLRHYISAYMRKGSSNTL